MFKAANDTQLTIAWKIVITFHISSFVITMMDEEAAPKMNIRLLHLGAQQAEKQSFEVDPMPGMSSYLVLAQFAFANLAS